MNDLLNNELTQQREVSKGEKAANTFYEFLKAHDKDWFSFDKDAKPILTHTKEYDKVEFRGAGFEKGYTFTFYNDGSIALNGKYTDTSTEPGTEKDLEYYFSIYKDFANWFNNNNDYYIYCDYKLPLDI